MTFRINANRRKKAMVFTVGERAARIMTSRINAKRRKKAMVFTLLIVYMVWIGLSYNVSNFVVRELQQSSNVSRLHLQLLPRLTYVEKRTNEILNFYRHTLGCEITNASNVDVLAQILTSVDSQYDSRQNVTLNITGDVILALRYPEYERKPPEFIKPSHRGLFVNNSVYKAIIGRRNSSYYLNGLIELFAGGRSAKSEGKHLDCGQKTDMAHFKASFPDAPPWKGDINRNITTIDLTIGSPLLVPDGYAFQHFLDGVLPKLAQLTPFLHHPNVHFAMFTPRDAIIYEILEQIGIGPERIRSKLTPTNTEYQLNTCISPPTHPSLMRQGRKLMGVSEVLRTSMQSAYVVLITRSDSISTVS